jgi:hypothetical protein
MNTLFFYWKSLPDNLFPREYYQAFYDDIKCCRVCHYILCVKDTFRSHITLYVHAFLFCWHFSYRTCAFCKARSHWLQLPLAALHIDRHRVTSKIRLTMPRVKMSRADRNPWLAKMLCCLSLFELRILIIPLISSNSSFVLVEIWIRYLPRGLCYSTNV